MNVHGANYCGVNNDELTSPAIEATHFVKIQGEEGETQKECGKIQGAGSTNTSKIREQECSLSGTHSFILSGYVGLATLKNLEIGESTFISVYDEYNGRGIYTHSIYLTKQNNETISWYVLPQFNLAEVQNNQENQQSQSNQENKDFNNYKVGFRLIEPHDFQSYFPYKYLTIFKRNIFSIDLKFQPDNKIISAAYYSYGTNCCRDLYINDYDPETGTFENNFNSIQHITDIFKYPEKFDATHDFKFQTQSLRNETQWEYPHWNTDKFYDNGLSGTFQLNNTIKNTITNNIVSGIEYIYDPQTETSRTQIFKINIPIGSYSTTATGTGSILTPAVVYGFEDPAWGTFYSGQGAQSFYPGHNPVQTYGTYQQINGKQVKLKYSVTLFPY